MERDGIGVNGRDRGLQLVRPWLIAAQTPADQRLALLDEAPVPSCPVLIPEQYQLALGICSGSAPRLGEKHEGEQPSDLGLVRHEQTQDPAESDGLGAQIRLGRRLGLAGGVRQVDRSEHPLQSVWELELLGDTVWNLRRLDLVLGANQPLRHSGFAGEEGPRYVGRG